MDIELLSKMLKELLLDNDVVNLPTLGSFVAEIVPATFSDGGHTINPPYRKLYFRDNIETGDDLLVKMYASENNVTEEVAADVIKGFITEVKDLLNSRKSIVLPELGRLRATKENNYFFVPFENIDIYPEGEGLESIPLKIKSRQTEPPVEEPVVEPVPEVDEAGEETHEETPEETSDKSAEEEAVVLGGVEVVRLDSPSENTEDNDGKAPAEPATGVQKVAKPRPKSTLSKGWLRTIIVIGSILLAFALFILLFILLSHLFPAFFDRLLW